VAPNSGSVSLMVANHLRRAAIVGATRAVNGTLEPRQTRVPRQTHAAKHVVNIEESFYRRA